MTGKVGAIETAGVIGEITDRLDAAGFKYASEQADFIVRHVLASAPRDPLRHDMDEVGRAACLSWTDRVLDERIPIQLLVGYAWFHGHRIGVNPDVILPDSATEQLVDTAVSRIAELDVDRPAVAEVGTGTGACAVAIAHAIPGATVGACDVALEAVTLARRNVSLHGLERRVRILHGDGLDAFAESARFDCIVSNPPYLPDSSRDCLPEEVVAHSPDVALYGGSNGMSLIDEILAGARAKLKPRGWVCLEYGDEVRPRLFTRLEQLPWLEIVDVVPPSSERTWGAVVVLRRAEGDGERHRLLNEGPVWA